MLTALTTLAGVVASGVLVAGLATPAYGSQISDIYCELVGDNHPSDYHFRITAIAYYNENVDGPGIRRWYEFRYRLNGERNRTKNNVNIRVSESGQDIYAWDSPDDRKSDIWYSHRPATRVHTSVYGPSGPHDHRSNDLIEFVAIFDMFMDADPRCTAWVKK